MKEKSESPRTHYTVSAKDGVLRVKVSSSHPAESGLLGLKEIAKIHAAKVKRNEIVAQNRRHRERRKARKSG